MENQILINFNKKTGKVKPLHGVCCAPYSIGKGPEQTYIEKYFTEANIPYCRLHDCCGGYGGTFFVDVPNVFPNFDADEMNPENYDFHYTDEYIGAIQKTGCETYYRLGVTIEWGSKKYRATPPKDFAKWARICERIIMHYNEGWANGFHYNLTYWEIWNEPENPGNALGKCMWTGTKEEFFELYKVSSKYLKERFPNIKIGGYGSCGFYWVTRHMNYSKPWTDYFLEFLDFTKENECPLDFYSWHIYTGDEKELLTHAKYVRETLDAKGYTQTEAHLNEWNIHAEGAGFREKHTLEGASFNAVVLCMLQNENCVDMAHYYCFSLQSRYNGFLDQNDLSVEPTWYPFVAFGDLYRMGEAVDVEMDGNIYAMAAKNKTEYGILLANYNSETEKASLKINGLESEMSVQLLRIDETHLLEEASDITMTEDGRMTLPMPRHTVAYIKIKRKET